MAVAVGSVSGGLVIDGKTKCFNSRTLCPCPRHAQDNYSHRHDPLAFSTIDIAVNEQLWAPLSLAPDVGHRRCPEDWDTSHRHQKANPSYVLSNHCFECG